MQGAGTRYRAMFSHEVKNYALLTYGGEIILRGVALRSSRAEPFGERFLRQALFCTMQDDTFGVRDAFLSMVDAIRQRRLPTSDVASRVRLTKSADRYLAGRSTHREPQYEALINAGRTTWQAGERVRFYHAQNRAVKWLPDDSDEPRTEAGWETGTELPETYTFANRSPLRQEKDRRDYDTSYYVHLLVSSYAGRLRKAYAPEEWEQLFRLEGQVSLFDRPITQIRPQWIRCSAPEPD